mgnify:CR=1 FL=1
MNRNLLIILLLLMATSAGAQKPQLSLMFDVGPWIGYVHNPDPYATNNPWPQAQAGVGLGAAYKIAEKVYFSPEIGLEYYGFKTEYSSAKDNRDVTSNLALFYARLSPGITLRPASFFSIRAGVSIMGSILALGEYEVSTYYVTSGSRKIVRFTNDFSRIRNAFVVGPELSLGFHLPEESGLSFRLSGMLGINGIFKSDFDTPYNPRIARVGLGVGYVIPE